MDTLEIIIETSLHRPFLQTNSRHG